MEEVATIAEVIGILNEIKGILGKDDPLSTLTDGKLGDNDLEQMLMYDKEHTSLAEISSRLEVIDKRLDFTNQLIIQGFGFVGTFAFVLLSVKIFAWLFKVAGV